MNRPAVPFETQTPGTLTVSIYPQFAPFTYLADGRVVGSDVALLEAFADRHGLAVVYKQHAFADLWDAPGSGIADVAAAGIGAFRDRILHHDVTWSEPYIRVNRSLLIRVEDAHRYNAPEDFAGTTIVATPGSAAVGDAETRYVPHGVNLVTHVVSQDAVVQDILAGRIAAFAQGDVSNAHMVSTYRVPDGSPRLTLADVHPLRPQETLHFAVRRRDPRLVRAINDFILERDFAAKAA